MKVRLLLGIVARSRAAARSLAWWTSCNGSSATDAGDPDADISPYAKKGYVGHSTYDHASITRFIETKFKIPALTRRDANADPLLATACRRIRPATECNR